MSFRDLAMFNDSLLSKQTWRLLHNTNSLFYKVLKHLFFFFFSNCSILEARGSRFGSFAWTSILKGRDVILRGSRWQIENGKSVKVWQNHWLPRKHHPLVFSPLSSMEDATVDILIDTPTRQRNHGLIDEIFSPQ